MTQADMNNAGNVVLRRLMRVRDAAPLPQPAPPTPARAAATALGRAADRLYGLPVQPVAVDPGAVTLAELPELLPELPLLAVLQGPGESLGVLALSPEAVSALIEVQTLGRVTARPLERRRPSRSDAMLCADFVNALLAELRVEMAGVDGFDQMGEFRFASYLDDPRPLSLMLDDRAFRSLTFDVKFGAAGERAASLMLALPLSDAPVVTTAPAIAAPVTATPPKPSLHMPMQTAPVEVVGVLCRRQMSLGELRALTAGRMLTLPRVTLAEARLETRDGQLLATGKFGEADGCHAIRLRDPKARADTPPLRSAQPRNDALPVGDLAQPDPFRAPEPAPESRKDALTVAASA
ncbi:FliM/FliN family flagellar motor C-terminal domain-containing protein [Paracoccus sp. (in: a-proteobacteria)]|uniref:FliM/FliN family flagellar motor switch protein n=1 Tax=Paracoccus sp. TaxID=267 RepID=UPI0026E0C86D|nr:FliM/FliN family flagellar motor C-terminal domain-containing protein [Paracoccus sp. (in: a-proteobacteria)]MDO5648071.1 FliM/FliN family flagellar motor C-terminal domain-containing protein [Paracoccus sp. (in: a-proteobacteria)]